MRVPRFSRSASCSPVIYREHPPCDALRRHVACYWTLTSGAEPHDKRVLPDGCIDVLFSFGAVMDRGEERRGHDDAVVVGAMTRPLVAVARGRVDLLGVRFRPGEAFAFLAVAAHEHTDRCPGLGDVWGRAGLSLADELANLPAVERVRGVERALLDRLSRVRRADARVRHAVSCIETTGGRLRIGPLCHDLGLGERQLERAFRERVGVGPKMLARVMRLQALSASLRSRPWLSWSARATELGYVDQPHLVREVRLLANLSPTELANEMSGFSNTDASMRRTHPGRTTEESPWPSAPT